MAWKNEEVNIPLNFGVASETIEMIELPKDEEGDYHIYTEPFEMPEQLVNPETWFYGVIFTKGRNDPTGQILNRLEWNIDGVWHNLGRHSSVSNTYYWQKGDLQTLLTSHEIDVSLMFRYKIWYPGYTTKELEIATENYPGEHYRPYVKARSEYEIPVVSSLTPNNAIVDPRNDIILRWSHTGGNGVQELFKLQYTTDGANWTTVEQNTSRQSYTIPAGTIFGETVVKWRVQVKDTGPVSLSEVREASFTTTEIEQRPPTILGPSLEYLDNSKPITFTWIFNGNDGETQEKYEIDYSIDNGRSYINVKETSKDGRAVFQPYTFPPLQVLWKVRTINNFGDMSPWSNTARFNVIGRPATPTIQSVSNNAKPIIRWTSQGQEIYEIDILKDNRVVYTSGKIPSISDREYRLKDYLEDGSYTARLRIWNEFDLYSEYGARNFILDTPKPAKANISVISGEYGVTVEVEGKNGIAMLYRDDKPIGEIEGNAFIDYTGENNKSHVYFVRNINNEGNFTDSDKEVAGCSFRGNTLAIVDAPGNFINLRYGFGDTPGKQENRNTLGELNHYDGRVYPVVEHSEFKSLNKNLKFHIMDKEELDLLVRLVDAKKTMIYRDHFGDNIEGSILSINVVRSRYGYDVDFTINKTGV